LQDHTLKPRWGLIDIIIVYAAAVLLTLFAGRALAHILIDPVTLFISGAVLQSLIIIGLVLIFTLYINRARLADLGIKKPAGKQLLLYGLLGGALLMVLMVILGICREPRRASKARPYGIAMVLGFLRCRSPLQVATVFWLLAGGRRPYNAGTGLATKFISFLK
jgi:hypothetical protein